MADIQTYVKQISETTAWIKEHTQMRPRVAIVLGTGLGHLAREIEVVDSFSYKDIPHFPVSTVEGHSGRLLFGRLGKCEVMAMEGRFHYYEGYSMQQVTFPERIMQQFGIEYFFVSNASGGMNPSFRIGDLMVITDHINLFPEHPLHGPNFPGGPRFPDMHEIYDKDLRDIVQNTAEGLGIELRQGVYIQLTGPNFETPAEVRMCRALGADAIGMSTGCEAVVANSMGMKIVGISCVSNLACGLSENPLSHKEVIEASDKAAPLFKKLIRSSIVNIHSYLEGNQK